MAEKKSKKIPLSLNDSHYRLLQDLSAPPKPFSHDNNIPQFSGITDFDSPLGEGEAKPLKVNSNSRDDESIPQFSGITDFYFPIEKEKPTKVKIEGRRRLCKVSTGGDDSTCNNVVLDEPRFYDFTDFDSPPLKDVGENVSENRAGNEIRDILNDLSSKFDFLSIEKNRFPKRIEPIEDDLNLMKEKELSEEKKVDLPEYASAGSSFSIESDISDSSSDMIKSAGGGAENVAGEHDEKNHFGNASDCNMVHGVKNDNERPYRYEPGNVGGKLMSKGHSFVTEIEEGFNAMDDSSEDGVHGIKKHAGVKTSDPQPQRMDKKLVPVQQSFVSKVEENGDEEGDCVVLSGKKIVKVVERRGKKFKDEYVDSDGVEVLADCTDDSGLENDGSIQLSGPKSTFKLPSKIATMLYPHQRDGLRWLWSLHCQGKGGILGDDMGLGKTMQICGFLAGLFHSRLIKRAMVVAPKTLIPHWIKELSAVGLSEKIREYYGTCPKARQYELQYILQDRGVLLTTYDIVRNNSKFLRGDYYDDEGSEDSVTWDYMMLDEGHLVKNPSTQRAKSLLEIPSAHRIIISGTPLQNNLKELWALFNFCCPDLLGDKQWFKEKFEYAILRGNEKRASDREKRIGSAVAKELRERIQPYFLRRLKSEVFSKDNAKTSAKLSMKNEVIVWLRLTSCQRQLYEAFLKSELVLSAFDGSPLAALTVLFILKKICDHPLLLTKRAAEDVLEGMESMLKPEDVNVAEKLAMHIADVAETDDLEENHDNVSCKIFFILSLLDNLIPEGHNVLIFSQTRKMLNLIQDSIVSKGYKFLRIDGTTKAGDRLRIVNDFQEGVGAPIFLLTSQVGGLGLTLTRADRVIVVDPAWNPSTDNQSVDRAYRIGQKKDVIVYRLMTCGTVEEKIYRKQIFKGGLFKTATEHKEQIRYFSQQDLRELFSLPEQGFDVSVTQQQLHEEHDCQHIMDAYLKAHIEFLETQGIAGVSHHSLLYSKTAPVQVVQEDEEVISKKRTTSVGYSSSSSSLEHIVDGAAYAFRPHDVNLNKKSSSPDSVGKLTGLEIKDKINRLSQILGNKAMVARLPDKGEKLQKQIAELNSELYKIREAERNEDKVIDLDDLTGEIQTVLNV